MGAGGSGAAAAMRRLLPAAFEARNGVLIALWGLCLSLCRRGSRLWGGGGGGGLTRPVRLP